MTRLLLNLLLLLAYLPAAERTHLESDGKKTACHFLPN